MLDNDIFSNTFHGIVFIGNFTPNEENFAKTPLANLLLNKVALLVKVVRGEGLHVVKCTVVYSDGC